MEIDELVRGVGIALTDTGLASCQVLDRDRNDQVTVDELTIAVRNATATCP